MFKRILLSLSLVFLAPLACTAQDSPVEYKSGTHYNEIVPAVRTADPSKIEVVEFFWHGCSHCYNFEPQLGQWKKSLPEDVDFQGSPAIWNKAMELHAKAYYTAKVLNVLDTVHPALFQAMNVDRMRLGSEEEIGRVFEANGVSKSEFQKVFNSFGVSSQVQQSASRAKSAKITGTPELMVNGKYHISTRSDGITTQSDMLKVASFLIEKERAAMAATAQ